MRQRNIRQHAVKTSKTVLPNEVATGTARLAKDLLERVLKGWRDRAPGVVDTVAALVRGADRAATAIANGDAVALGEELDAYWVLKQKMAAGAEPDRVRAMIESVRDRVHGAALCGAGGGGFLVLIAKAADDVPSLRAAFGMLACDATFHYADVDRAGVLLERSGRGGAGS